MDIRLWAPIATTIAMCVSSFLWYLNWRKKALSYSILQCHPVLNLKGAARDKLDIRFAGHSISDAYLVIIRIFNSGHLPINSGDYQTVLSVLFNPGTSILAASVIETSPADLEERIKQSDSGKSLIERVEGERISLVPVLLNQGDSMTLQVLVQNTTGDLKIHGHMQGINSINLWRENRVIPKTLTHIGALVMAFAMLAVEPSDIVACRFEHVLPWLLIFLLGYVLLNGGLYWPRSVEPAGFQGTN